MARTMAGGAKPRVFVSSVVEGFQEFRDAARRGIEAAGAEPVLVNEDFPSLPRSSRNACLDAVESCDYLVSLVGARGGWTTPSGRLVVEEEYEHARGRGIPVLAFLQAVERDAGAERFARTVSDYVEGTFRRTFHAPQDLQREVEGALRPLIESSRSPVAMDDRTRTHFASPYAVQATAMLRFVLVPERVEEVIDPVTLGSGEFLDRVYQIAHASTVRLLHYEWPKRAGVERDSLVITQSDATHRRGPVEHVRLEIAESGVLVIDANVTGRAARGPRDELRDSFQVALEDVESVLATCFRFAAAFYDAQDAYKRHQQFQYNVGLSGLDHRRLVRNPQPRSSYQMSMRSSDRVLLGYDSGRMIDRGALSRPDEEIRRVVVLL